MNDHEANDADLLRQYLAGSESAFRELVERHLGMVHATARRVLTTTPHLADDVTQAVFTDLAKNARTLSADVVLGGWLHRHTCYLALNVIRTESRRLARERTAMEINALNDNSGTDAHWAQLAPVLDDALNHLSTEDRDAVVLRYLEQRDLRSIGAALGSSEDAAQKRISRALEKLRAFLTSRGITVSAVLLSSALDAGAATSPISGSFSSSISATALASSSASTTTTHAPLSPKTMNTSKLVLGLVAIIAAIGLVGILITQNQTSVPIAQAAVPAPAPKLPAPAIGVAKVEAPKQLAAPSGDANPSTNNLPASRVVFIGQVNQPGVITPMENITLVQALSRAGGPTPNASGTVSITRTNPDGTTTVLKNIDILGATKDATKDIPLQNGDVITLGASAAGNVWQ